MHGQRAGLLDGAVGATGHAVAAPGVGKPEVLGRDRQEWGVSTDPVGEQSPSWNPGNRYPRRVLERAVPPAMDLESWFRPAHLMLVPRPCYKLELILDTFPLSPSPDAVFYFIYFSKGAGVS